VVTLGDKGCVTCRDGKSMMIPPMHLASSDLKIVSTVGAGDTFVGAFGAFKLKGFEDSRALYFANVAERLRQPEKRQGQAQLMRRSSSM